MTTVPPSTFLNRAERHALGKAARSRVPRDANARLPLPKNRDVIAILERQHQQRIGFLVPERIRRMAASAFAFYRGAAAVMAADFVDIPKTGLLVQAAGDSHLMNFGSFISPEGRILFDINDFDETIPGVDFTVDVRRLAASLAVAANDAKLSKKQQRHVAIDAVSAYREMMRALAPLSPYEIWQHRIDLAVELDRLPDKRLRTHIANCLRRVPSDEVLDDDVPHLEQNAPMPRFQDRDQTIFHARDAGSATIIAEATAAFRRYPALLLPERRMLIDRYRLVDTAFKVVGVGSVGTLCAIGLYATPDNDMLVLQLKEAQTSVNIDLVADPSLLAGDDNNGRRVVEGQRAMQAASDVFLNWIPVSSPTERHFYVRHLKTQRLQSLNALIASDIHDANALTAYGVLCARTLARAHARTGDPIAISAYLGKSSEFEDAVGEFAVNYVAINQADYARLVQTYGEVLV